MTDAERVLAVLIHDVRTPLGVAHGYLRLVRADKLPSPEDRERALAGTQDALAKISRLCQEAGGFLEDPRPGTARASARQLSERVAAVLADRGVAVGALEPPDGSINVGTSMDRAAEAIATLLSRRRCASRAARPATARRSRRWTPRNVPSIRGNRRRHWAWRWPTVWSPRWADGYGRQGMA
jgi:signal transduction histidine kinase